MSARLDLRARFFSTLRAHVVSRVVQGIVALALVPYVLAHLSREEYGLWSWLLAMSSWLTLADLGLSVGNVNPLARALAAKDERRIGETFVAAIVLHVGLTLLVFALAGAARGPLISPLPPDERTLAFHTLSLLIAAQGLMVVSFPFGALLSALQRLDLVHKVQTAQLVVQAVGTVAVLGAGGRVFELACLQVLLAAIQLGARVVLCRRLHPSLRPAWPRTAELPGLLSAGLPVVLLGVTGAIALNYERTFLGFAVDLALLAQYAVAARLVMSVREVPSVLLSALIPASAALDVAGDDRALERLYARSFKLTATVILALVATLWVCSPMALRAWLGSGFEEAGRVARPLALGFLVPLLTAPAVQILMGRSRLGRLAPVYAIWAVGFVICNTAWLRLTGFAGAGWGTAVIDLLGTAALFGRLHSRAGLGSVGIGRVLASAAGAAVVGAIAGEIVVRVLGGALGVDSRATALLVAASGAAVVWATAAALALVSGLFDAEDRRLLAEAVGLGRSLDRRAPFA